MTRDEVIEKLCGMMGRVWSEIDPNSNDPCDCVCRNKQIFPYRNSGEALAFMQKAIDEALRARHLSADSVSAAWAPSKGDRVRLVKKIACTAPVGSEGEVTMVWEPTTSNGISRPAEFCVDCEGFPPFVTNASNLAPAHRTETAQVECEPTRCEHDMNEQWNAALEAAACIAARNDKSGWGIAREIRELKITTPTGSNTEPEKRGV
ncbi:hypothetical protein [Labilithrix luteola]|nr:hypothetical protein [Labilithrix luteola]